MRSFDVSNDRLGILYGLSAQEDGETNLAALSQQQVHHSRVSETECSKHVKVTEEGDTESIGAFEQAHDNGSAEERIPSRGKFRLKKSPSKVRKSAELGFKYHRSHKDYNVAEDRGDEHRAHRSKRRRCQHRSEDKCRHSRHQTSSRKETVDYEAKGYSKPARQFSDDPAAYDDTYLPNTQSLKFVDADAAFRESLFDAMADDEGAAFWEGVYGQRVDIYSRPGVEGPTGVLEQMGDDEYAAFVRKKMYEKTNEYIVEERLKREKARMAAKEGEKRKKKEWEEAEKQRLRKEKARREERSKESLCKAWERYSAAWSKIMSEIKRDGVLGAELIPWPVASGRLEDVDRKTIEKFYLSAPVHKDGDGLYNLLKTERVKWHPDKMQQRWGQLGKDVIVGINTTFQAIDSMWVECRGQSSKAPGV